MKKTNFTHLVMLIGLTILSNVCLTQLKAQMQWKELTVYGSSHVNTNGNPNGETQGAGLLTKDKAGNIYAALGAGIFKWNGTAWSELGGGTLNAYDTYSIITDNNGNVYAACFFIDRTPQYQVVKWDGTRWSELGAGNTDLNANNFIGSLTVDKEGNIYAAGSFSNGTGNAYVAKWNGLFWTELGSDVGAGSLPVTRDITSIATDSSGNIYAAGLSINVEKWDGAQWSAVGSLTSSGGYELVIDSKTNIYANNVQNVYEWSGTTWTQLGTGDNADLYANALALDAKDSLYESSSLVNTFVEKWNGTSWVQVGSGSNGTFKATSLVIDNAGNIYSGLTQTNPQTFVTTSYITKWNGSTWAEAGNINGALNPIAASSIVAIFSTANDKFGNEYAAGNFTDTLGKEYVAKWNGSIWSELGTGANALNANGEIDAITTDGAGNVYAAGAFKNGSVRTYVAKWNGTNWSELGGGTIGALFANNPIFSIAVDAGGNVYAAGNFTNTSGKYYVAKWDGTAWAELGSGATALNANGSIYSICLDSKGNVYAAGYFSNTNSYRYVAEWNGSTWAQLAGSEDVNFFSTNIATITSDSAGNIYAGYDKSVAKWNGSAWAQLGNDFNDYINSIKTDKSGIVYAAGGSQDDSVKVSVQKWDGTSWSKVGYDFGIRATRSQIYSINIDDTKDYIYAGGTFLNSRAYTDVAYNSTTNEILPIKLLSFTAQKQNTSTLLQWQTANEINNDHFSVERSGDARSFTAIGDVQEHNNTIFNNYEFTDNAPLNGLNYYRFKQVDKDGNFTYSNIVSVNFARSSNVLFTISPNPAKDHINITSPTAISDAQIAITNVNGSTLYSFKHNFTNGEHLNVPVASFANQTLFITITTKSGKQTFKVVKE